VSVPGLFLLNAAYFGAKEAGRGKVRVVLKDGKAGIGGRGGAVLLTLTFPE